MFVRRFRLIAILCLGAVFQFGCPTAPSGGDGSPNVNPFPNPGTDPQVPPPNDNTQPPGTNDNTAPPDTNEDPPDGEPSTPTIGGADELAFIEAMTLGPRRTFTRGGALMNDAVFVVFTVSIHNGNALTTTGTATFDAQSNLTAYSPAPPDRLIVNHPNQAFEFVITEFVGDFSSRNAFLNDHSAFKFRGTVVGTADLQIDSIANNAGFRQHFVGTVMLPRGEIQTDIVRAGGDFFDINPPVGAVEALFRSSIVGIVNAAGGTIQASEVFRDRIVNTSQDIQINVTSTGVRNGANYAFVPAFFRQTEKDGFATEPDFWRAIGGLERDEVLIGTCKYDGDIIVGRPSPPRILELIDSTKVDM